MMSPEERRRRGTELCLRLAADVRSLVPQGIGSWPECWQIVADADTTFMIALNAWESSPTPTARKRTQECYEAVLVTWRRASEEYQLGERAG